MPKTLPAPHFTLQDIKYADDEAMFLRAQELFAKGRVKHLQEIGLGRGYSAIVQGSKPYHVWLDAKHFDKGNCTCYMGENNILCKHMLALALAALDATGNLHSSSSSTNLEEAKSKVSQALKKLRPYSGPSRVWFSYQRSLASGAGMLIEAIQALPATEQNATYLWQLVIRISKKLATSGIDDSDGVVGNCVTTIIEQLAQYAHDQPSLKPIILQCCESDTGFNFENDLRALL